ncbi:hypothetical protein POSPLADRAFT_1054300 [Postia placenta MAD-698-R-SB12]|uniref:Vacuolar calcium ion transporter n=1 Tax=Postia placenta MAD-698-R-SB12 TaxID=670580 RepID=A0A1X6NB20_9APHY|nr:hypothetical protein POSPLADRAFT_1054300 [Postia placenta MAD-698-R-SB12]OSX65563.1 hypothetical protein POSPLADRAFT_1054300 [Postia placenta MAD-698-R-SB12]
MSATNVDLIPFLEAGTHSEDNSFDPRRVSEHGEPSWLASYRFFLLGSWLNLLLVCVPLSVISHLLGWNAGLRFVFSFFSLIPLAGLLGTATDQMSAKLGQTLAGLINASFGNAVEAIIGIAALSQGRLRIVQTSMLGSVLSNLLLVFGSSLIAGGLKFSEVKFDPTIAQTSGSLMTLTCIALVLPAAYHYKAIGEIADSDQVDTAASKSVNGVSQLSRGTAILLLAVYTCYLLFQLKTHAFLYNVDTSQEKRPHTEALLPSEEDEKPEMNVPAAVSALLLVTGVTSFCASYLVASIEETAERYGIPEQFIGTILLPIVSNAADHATAVWMARKNKMEITIGICVGSSIQILAFVVPFLVLVGWATRHDLSLNFGGFETITLFVAVAFVQYLIQDGKSNYMEGVMLISLYFMIALSFWAS